MLCKLAKNGAPILSDCICAGIEADIWILLSYMFKVRRDIKVSVLKKLGKKYPNAIFVL